MKQATKYWIAGGVIAAVLFMWANAKKEVAPLVNQPLFDSKGKTLTQGPHSFLFKENYGGFGELSFYTIMAGTTIFGVVKKNLDSPVIEFTVQGNKPFIIKDKEALKVMEIV